MKTDIPINISEMKDKSLQWLQSLKTAEGHYRITKNGGESLFTSCAAVFIRELFNDLQNITPKERIQWISYLQGLQDPATGYFSDTPVTTTQDRPGNYWESVYVLEEATQFCVMALTALNSQPLYVLSFMNLSKQNVDLIEYFKKLDWREPWYQSNKVMFRLSLLIDDFERNGSKESKELTGLILDWLDSWQDPKTGLWGTNKGSAVYHGVFTAFHFIYFYFYLNRKLNYIPALIDSTLSIQNRRDGLFSPHGAGGACPDLDGVDILVKCSMVTDYRKDDIEKALEKAFYGILQNRNKDNGFCWSKVFPFTPVEWLRSIPNILNTTSRSRGILTELIIMAKAHCMPRGYSVKYCGLDYLSYYTAESNIFSAWFRLLTLALIDSRYPGKYSTGLQWNFPKKAGLGWHSTSIVPGKEYPQP